MDQLNLNQVLLLLAENDQKPTLETGQIVYFDKIERANDITSFTIQKFKEVLGTWYNFEYVNGEFDNSIIAIYRITGALHPSI